MSDSEKKEASQIFTISMANQEDSTEVPDIAELLGKKKEPIKKAKGIILEKTNTAIVPPLKSLAEFGTYWEAVFEKKEDGYHFIKHQFFSEECPPSFKEVLKGMKIPTVWAKEFSDVNEFTRAEKNFLFDAFGIVEHEFVQIVMTHDQKFMNVYISHKSMKMKKQEVTDFVIGRNTEMLKSAMDNRAA